MDTYYQNLPYDYEASASSKFPKTLKLMFSSEVASPVFTGQIITGGDGGNEPVKVMLVDTNTQETITTGPVASTRVKIVLIRGDYDGSTTREFKKHIVVDWKKKKNILQGCPYFDLKHGCVTIGEIKIKHDRNPIKNTKFRLAAMVVDCPYEVQEAITRPFDVKDLRNLPKTLRRLSLEDDVGRLKNISNKRRGMIYMRLKSRGILTVRKFLEMHFSNPLELQKICGIKGKKWEMTVNHAKTSLKGNMHIESTSQQSNTLASDDCDDDGIEFSNVCYRPWTCENEPFNIPMAIDPSFSTTEIEVWGFDMFEPCQASQERGMNGASDLVGRNGVKAKKRWMKLCIFSFSIVTFTKKVGLRPRLV